MAKSIEIFLSHVEVNLPHLSIYLLFLQDQCKASCLHTEQIKLALLEMKPKHHTITIHSRFCTFLAIDQPVAIVVQMMPQQLAVR